MNDRDVYTLKRKNAIEEPPFADPIVKSIFHVFCEKWTEKTFNICFLNRTEWEQKGAKILEKDASANETLFIPEDATSAEMETILETAGKPKGLRVTRRILESPKNALANFLFEKGFDLLMENLPLPYGTLPWDVEELLPPRKIEQKTLRETGLIEMFSADLNELKKTGNTTLIAKKELYIARMIQKVVREYPFRSNCQNATEILKRNGARNCRGSSLQGIAIFCNGIGIKCLIGDLPKHSIVIVLLSNDTLEWFDMTAPIFNGPITPEMIGGILKTGNPLTYADVIAYAKNPTPDGLMIDIVGDDYLKKLSWIKKGQRQFLTLFPPKLGSQMQVLNGIAFELANFGYEEMNNGNMGPTREKYYFRQAIEACKLSIGYDPAYQYAYNTMGNAFHELGEYENAIDAYQHSFKVNPLNTECHYGLGRANFALGQKKEALASYEKCILLADPEAESFWITDSKEKIALLKK